MPNNLLIIYTLRPPGQQYRKTKKLIEELGESKKIDQTVWYVSSAYNADEAYEMIRGVATDENDSLIVIDATNNDLRARAKKPIVQFLKTHWEA